MATHTVAMLNSGFDYYEPLKVQSSIEDQFVVEVSPVNALQANTPFEFFIAGAEAESLYPDLSKSYLKIQIRVLAAGAAGEAADEISCVQNLAHSLFTRIEVYANDKLINDPNGLYPYRAYFAELLSRGYHAQKTWMPMQGWTDRDLPGDAMDSYLTTTGNANKTALARNEIMGKSEVLTLIMKPHLEVFNIDKFFPPGIRLRFKFTPAPVPFYIKRNAGNKAITVEIQDAKFYCQMVKATHVQNLSVMEALRKVGPMRINLNRVMIKHMTIGTGSTTANLDNIYFGPIPNRIILGMVLDSSLSGGLKANPFNFQNFGLNYLSLYVNGKLVPNPPFQPNWTSGDYKREYLGTIQALNRSFSEQPVAITLEEFKSGYTIFVFDLTADNNSQTSISDQGSGNVRVLMRFATGLTAPIAVILHAEYDAYMLIDQYKNVTGNF